VPDMSATIVSVSVTLSITSAVVVDAAVARAPLLGVDTAGAAGLAVTLDFFDRHAITDSLGAFAFNI